MKVKKHLYIQIFETLLDDIKNKKYATSQKLPSENILAQTYNVNQTYN